MGMLSGYQPFNSHSIHAMYGMIIRGQYKFPSPHWDNISDDAKDLVKKLMCVDIKKRYNAQQIIKHQWIIKHVDLKKLQQREEKLLKQQKEIIEHLHIFDGNKNKNSNNNNNDNAK